MMMNLQTLALSLVVQIALIWRKARLNLHELSPEVICETFCGWNLQHVMQIVSISRRVICPLFCDLNHQDHVSISLPLTSLESPWV